MGGSGRSLRAVTEASAVPTCLTESPSLGTTCLTECPSRTRWLSRNLPCGRETGAVGPVGLGSFSCQCCVSTLGGGTREQMRRAVTQPPRPPEGGRGGGCYKWAVKLTFAAHC